MCACACVCVCVCVCEECMCDMYTEMKELSKRVTC